VVPKFLNLGADPVSVLRGLHHRLRLFVDQPIFLLQPGAQLFDLQSHKVADSRVAFQLRLIYVGLQHVVVLLFGRQRFLEHGDVPLVIRVLLLQGLHLGANRQHVLVSSRNLGSEFFQLKIRLNVSRGRVNFLARAIYLV
jgi:hypothetical protein